MRSNFDLFPSKFRTTRRENGRMKKSAVVILLSAFFVLAGPRLAVVSALADWHADESLALQILRLELRDTGKVARIYYMGACENARHAAWELPLIEMHAPTENETGLDAVRAIFQNYGEIAVTEEPEGIIRVRIGEFPDAILQTRISQLDLTAEGQFNPNRAVMGIISDEDVVAATDALGLHHPTYITSFSPQLPMPGLPHLPPSLSDLTMDQALDDVALSFHAIVTYAICPETGLFNVDYVLLDEIY